MLRWGAVPRLLLQRLPLLLLLCWGALPRLLLRCLLLLLPLRWGALPRLLLFCRGVLLTRRRLWRGPLALKTRLPLLWLLCVRFLLGRLLTLFRLPLRRR